MKVVTVSYLNTLPFIQGLESTGFDLVQAYPAKCAELLHSGEADIALIPVGALQETNEYFVLSDYGIGADGKVRTVALFGERPLTHWNEVILDYQSRTSVLLTQVLLEHYWDRKIKYSKGYEGYEQYLNDRTGGLIIGDRAFTYEKHYPFRYDLAEAWKSWTGFPFIFAVWVSLKQLRESDVIAFSESLEFGLQNFQISSAISNLNIDIESYYRDNISYRLSDEHWMAFERFNELLGRKKLKINRL